MSTASANQDREAGKPAPRLTFPTWPNYDDDEIAAATAVLRSGRVNYWTGTEGRSFEQEYARAVGVSYAIALANGSVALELALAMLGIGPGDEVITSPRTFIASASCAIMRGAKPVFADVDRDSQNITRSEHRAGCNGPHLAPSLSYTWPGGRARWMPFCRWQEPAILR